MNILYYDCFSGISGDMNLGAMIDLGVAEEYLRSELDKLNLDGWKLITEKDQRHGIFGTKVTVQLTRHEHSHRHLADIEKIIRESTLDENTKNLSLKIFMKVAEAEASVHKIAIEKVHFHEVGAIDSIIDIVGAAICFCKLRPDAVYVSPVELGSGFVKCDHGTLPVPAPATSEIIKGIPATKGGVSFEATTPTGAAIIAALGTSFNPSSPIRIKKTGYGIGHKENPSSPNILRVFLAEAETESTGHNAVQIECNIDDMNPEFFEHISEKLFSSGASDVFISGIIMKKGRPGNVLSVICEPGLTDIVRDILFKETTSVGIRSFVFRKDTLPRIMELIDTPFGKITFKRSFLDGKEVSLKPEYEEIRKIAVEKGIPLKEIYNKIMASVVIKDYTKKIDD
jgi:pyridinium-3,5-bisthiocarboxylic acid mononucleotide nickel chelatase